MASSFRLLLLCTTGRQLSKQVIGDNCRIGPAGLIVLITGPRAEEVDGGRVGSRVDHLRHLVADAVASHRRHGVISDRMGRRPRSILGLSAVVATGVSGGRISGAISTFKRCAMANYRAANGRAGLPRFRCNESTG